jgi:hypothetical protein
MLFTVIPMAFNAAVWLFRLALLVRSVWLLCVGQPAAAFAMFCIFCLATLAKV